MGVSVDMGGRSGRMIEFEQAVATVREHVGPLPASEAALTESLGLVLAWDMAAEEDMPPFDRSAMDGYAVRAADVAATPATLRMIEDIPAGAVPTRTIEAGQCARIMTGAPVPPGADTVVMVEKTEPGPDAGRVVVNEPLPAGKNIRYRGEEFRAGQVVLSAGRRLGPAEAALAASCGWARVPVYPRPRVAVLSTGDEIVPIDRVPGPGQIRDANSYYIQSRLQQALGVEAERLGIAGDDADVLASELRRGLPYDVLLTSGAVSAGTYDLLPSVMRQVGIELLFEQVAMQPGRPLLFGRRGAETVVFGLPGNPVAVMVTVEMFVLPALRRMMGFAESALAAPVVEAVLEAPIKHRAGRRSHKPAALRCEADGYHVSPVGYKGAAHIAALSEANALVIQPPEEPVQPAGSRVRVVRLGE